MVPTEALDGLRRDDKIEADGCLITWEVEGFERLGAGRCTRERLDDDAVHAGVEAVEEPTDPLLGIKYLVLVRFRKRNLAGDLVGGGRGALGGSGGRRGSAAGQNGLGRRSSDTHSLNKYVSSVGSGK